MALTGRGYKMSARAEENSYIRAGSPLSIYPTVPCAWQSRRQGTWSATLPMKPYIFLPRSRSP